MMRNALRTGFTLVEILVTLIILGILVAVVFPMVVSQVDDAEPTKAANDLANIRTGIELFHLNVRPTYAGDIEDLATEITSGAAGDTTILAPAAGDFGSSDVTRWRGPYIDAPVTSVDGDAAVITTAFSGGIVNDLKLFDLGNNTSEDFTTNPATTSNADFIAIQINALTTNQFEAINDLIDPGETDGAAAGQSQVSGRFRYLDPDGAGGNDTAFYLAVPFQD